MFINNVRISFRKTLGESILKKLLFWLPQGTSLNTTTTTEPFLLCHSPAQNPSIVSRNSTLLFFYHNTFFFTITYPAATHFLLETRSAPIKFDHTTHTDSMPLPWPYPFKKWYSSVQVEKDTSSFRKLSHGAQAEVIMATFLSTTVICYCCSNSYRPPHLGS